MTCRRSCVDGAGSTGTGSRLGVGVHQADATQDIEMESNRGDVQVDNPSQLVSVAGCAGVAQQVQQPPANRRGGQYDLLVRPGTDWGAAAHCTRVG